MALRMATLNGAKALGIFIVRHNHVYTYNFMYMKIYVYYCYLFRYKALGIEEKTGSLKIGKDSYWYMTTISPTIISKSLELNKQPFNFIPLARCRQTVSVFFFGFKHVVGEIVVKSPYERMRTSSPWASACRAPGRRPPSRSHFLTR